MLESFPRYFQHTVKYRIDIFGSFSAIFCMGDNFCDFLFAVLHTNPIFTQTLLSFFLSFYRRIGASDATKFFLSIEEYVQATNVKKKKKK